MKKSTFFKIDSFWPKILPTRMDQRGGPHENYFEYFQIQKWILQAVREEKSRWKKGVICLVSMFPSWVMVLKLSTNVHFCNFVLTPARNLTESIKAIYIYASERSRCVLLENCIVYYAMTQCFGDIWFWSQRVLLNFCWVNIFFDILNGNIWWTMAQTTVNHVIFWKSEMRTFRCIYVNCLGFLLRSAQNWSAQPHFFHYFLSVCSIHFYIWKQSKTFFVWFILLLILVCKAPQFWAKATNSGNPSYFSRKQIPWGY